MQLLQFTVGMVMTNCYMIFNEETKEAALIDPGDQADCLLEQCRRRGLTLKALLLTHGHFDHILAVPALQRETGASVYAARAEAALLADSQANLSGSWQRRPLTFTPDVLLEDREEFTLLGSRMQMILTPGHTAGSCCYYLPEEKWLFSGDTLFCESYGRTDLPTSQPAEIGRSIREKLLILPQETAVYPGHNETSTIEHEKKYNPAAC